MSVSLVLISGVTPLEGLAIDCLKRNLGPTYIFDYKSLTFLGEENTPSPSWIELDGSSLSNDWFRAKEDSLGVSQVIAIGLEAGEIACLQHEWQSVITLVRSGDLDFSQRRTRKQRQFEFVSTASLALVFTSEIDMYKAVVKGSKRPHFLWNFVADIPRINFEKNANNEVDVFYESAKLEDRAGDELAIFEQFNGGKLSNLDMKSSNSFYWYTDLEMGRQLAPVAHLRFKAMAGVFLESGVNSLICAAMLAKNGIPAFMPNGIEQTVLSEQLNKVYIGNFSRLADLVNEKVDKRSRPEEEASDFHYGLPLAQIIFLASVEGIPWYWESFCPTDVHEFGVFISVAPVEERSDGARPQRIRNMYLALRRKFPVIQLSFNPNVLERRRHLLRYLRENGIAPVATYGENSTTPVMNLDQQFLMTRILDEMSIKSIPSSWFVRDLHWLDDEIELQSKISNQELRRYGLLELEQMSGHFNALLTPSHESRVMFEHLCGEEYSAGFSEIESPPAVSRSNCSFICPEGQEEERPTFVYSGGLGKTYDLSTFLDAYMEEFSCSSARPYLDFVVRESEAPALVQELRNRNLFNTSVRIMHGSFDVYRPRSSRVFGILLLNSTYGKSSFPFKSVSYIERGIPIVCFDDSPVYRRFSKYGVTIATGESTDSVRKTLRKLQTTRIEKSVFEKVWKYENWDNRLSEALEAGAPSCR